MSNTKWVVTAVSSKIRASFWPLSSQLVTSNEKLEREIAGLRDGQDVSPLGVGEGEYALRAQLEQAMKRQEDSAREIQALKAKNAEL